jgi:lipopolysaccharide transport system ATP-binding protein
MSDVAIRVEGLGKRYRIGERERYTALRDVLTRAATAPFRAWRNGTTPADDQSHIWALKDVSFQVKRGEVVGVIGRNGAGKSTLLKILSRITEPTEGGADVHGRVGSLLEVGTGFHPELTGRENVYLNGAILGMKRTEIEHKFDEIVAFAEVERFIDTPVKHYSSGMHMRLAFAVAAHLEPEILVVDEVLAVGDAEFQKKCIGKMSEVASHGRTVLFVSHNLMAVRRLCTRGVVFDRGRKVHDGTALTAIEAYSIPSFSPSNFTWRRAPSYTQSPLHFQELSVELSGDQPNLLLQVRACLESHSPHQTAFVAFDILDAAGTAIMQALPKATGFLQYAGASHLLRVDIQLPPLIPGTYGLTAWVGPHNSVTFDEVKEVVQFEINASPDPYRTYPHTPDHGYLVPQSRIVDCSSIKSGSLQKAHVLSSSP